MKVFIAFFSVAITVLIISAFAERQKMYLPVYIDINDSTLFRKEILLSFKAAFNSRKIKVISKEDVLTYIKNEIEKVTGNYYKNGGNMGNFEQIKVYYSANMQKVANSLNLQLHVTSDGIINDTIKWSSYTVPIDFLNPPKKGYNVIILDSTNSSSLFQITQSVADSIIASNVLVKE